MSNNLEVSSQPKPQLPPVAIVARVIDDFTIAINKGRQDGVKLQQKYLVYGLSEEEVLDPETKERLGYLEIVRGYGEVIHVQEKIATIKSNRKTHPKRTIRRPRSASLFGARTEEIETIEDPEGILEPFDDVVVGDRVKPIY